MKITWVGHACLFIETAQTRCLTDPWLSDPIFGGAIRHAPPRVHSLEDLPVPDIVCITHCHFDHFDAPTLSRLPKNIRVVIPWSPIRNIRGELKALGLRNVVELKPWKSHRFRDLTVTAIPSIGVPEEVAYVIDGKGHAVFDAADCIFEEIAAEIGRKFKLQIGFIPFCGWDHAGLMGLQPEKKWKPDYEALAKACVNLGLDYVVPAASNTYWYPDELMWLNDRVSPGRASEFAEALKTIGAEKTRPLLMSPGDQWLCEEERVVKASKAPVSQTQLSKDQTWQLWLKDSRLRIYTPDELTSALNRFLFQRRNHLLKIFPLCPKVIAGLLTTRFEFASKYEGKTLFWEINFLRWNPVRRTVYETPAQDAPRAGLHFGIFLKWQDFCAMIQGLVDSQDLVISSRMKMYYLPKSEYFGRIYGLEYIFFTRSFARLQHSNTQN